jgi:hypothetical protein
VSLNATRWAKYAQAPYMITRNLTIAGAPGGGFPELNFNYMPMRLALGDWVRLTWTDLRIANPT